MYGGFGLTTSLPGVVYCLVSGNKLDGCILKIDKIVVAEGRLEIFLWVLDNAYGTFQEAIRLTLEYEKQHEHAA